MNDICGVEPVGDCTVVDDHETTVHLDIDRTSDESLATRKRHVHLAAERREVRAIQRVPYLTVECE